jgi:hypothetical protein
MKSDCGGGRDDRVRGSLSEGIKRKKRQPTERTIAPRWRKTGVFEDEKEQCGRSEILEVSAGHNMRSK